MKKKIIFFFNVIYLVFLLQPSSSLEPNIFVQSTVNRASQILSDNISKNEKIEKLKVIAKDLSLIHISEPRDQRGSRMPSSA